jgi:hypothetical protein
VSSAEGNPEPDEQPDPLGVLAEILDRDGQALSASRTWRQALADADHLAVLNATWTAETTRPATSATGTCSPTHSPRDTR